MSPLPAWLETPPPTLALAIDADRVVALVASRDGATASVEATAEVRLPAGAIVPSLTGPNVMAREPVVTAIRQAVAQVGGRHRRCALVVADTVAKVTLLRFEQVPAQARDLEQLIRLQLRKALPFPVEQAQVSIVPGYVDASGHEFVVVAARREVVEAYEAACAAAGLHAGTIDLATLNVVNAVLLADGDGAAGGDWLLVHVGADYSSLAIVRDGHVIFFRTRPADAVEQLVDVVHQTRMYFEDRLAGRGFARVLLAGADAAGRTRLADDIEARLGVAVRPVDVSRAVAMGPRAVAAAAGGADLAAPIGVVARTW